MALQNMAISSLFPVQVAVWQETIGPGSFERDLCINSPTGSGKTLAYALPIVQMLSTRAIRCLRALVVLPTRDLALQVSTSTSFLQSCPLVILLKGILLPSNYLHSNTHAHIGHEPLVIMCSTFFLTLSCSLLLFFSYFGY